MIHARDDYNRIQDPKGKIPDDEPVFLIRAQDKVSGDAVRAWIDLAEKAGAGTDILYLAQEHAKKMDAWRKRKVPDLEKPLNTSFQDNLQPSKD